MKKISEIHINDTIDFIFLDQTQQGVVFEKNTKDNSFMVRTKSGMVYKVYFTEKDSKFCFLKNN